jgi:cysteine-rich repeat protein
MASCGDGVRDGIEQCDGSDFDGFTCADFCGTGMLSCRADCTFNLAGCAVCGNGIINPGETCDGEALGGAECLNGGTMACLADCSGLDDAGCYACGNGRREGPEIGGEEACDGGDIGAATCPTPTYHGGTPGCSPSCTLDFGPAYCWRCGDGTLQPGEECDAGAGNGTPGNNCSAMCEFRCGDGTVQQEEECDDRNEADGDGCSRFCLWETTYAGGTAGDTCPATTPACVDACYASWNTAVAAPGPVVPCQDGAACDRDNAANGECLIQYFLCLNDPQNVVPGGPPPPCFARDVKRVALLPATTLTAGDKTLFLDAVDEMLRRFSGSVTRDATSVTRTTGLNRGLVCGGTMLKVPASGSRVLAVATTDSGNPTDSGTNQKTDVDQVTFTCSP